MTTLPKRSNSYRSVFTRWDRLVPNKGILEPVPHQRHQVEFDHFAHKPYAVTSKVERIVGSYV